MAGWSMIFSFPFPFPTANAHWSIQSAKNASGYIRGNSSRGPIWTQVASTFPVDAPDLSTFPAILRKSFHPSLNRYEITQREYNVRLLLSQ